LQKLLFLLYTKQEESARATGIFNFSLASIRDSCYNRDMKKKKGNRYGYQRAGFAKAL